VLLCVLRVQVQEVTERLGLNKLRLRQWYIQVRSIHAKQRARVCRTRTMERCADFGAFFSLFVCLLVQGASAPTGDGLYEGLDWLSNTLSKRNN
jgi:hypothetical protein